MNIINSVEEKKIEISYRDQSRIQVIVYTANDPNCTRCNKFEQSTSSLKLAEKNGLIDLYCIKLDGKCGNLKNKFYYKFYIPWNIEQTPQIRTIIGSEIEVMNEFLSYKKK